MAAGQGVGAAVGCEGADGGGAVGGPAGWGVVVVGEVEVEAPVGEIAFGGMVVDAGGICDIEGGPVDADGGGVGEDFDGVVIPGGQASEQKW